MADLESRILNGKGGDNYCSSSEDEDDNKDGFIPVSEEDPAKLNTATSRRVPASNTGPKGVMEDWRRYKQLQIEQKQEQEKEMINLAKRLTMSSKSDKSGAQSKPDDDDFDLDEEFMKEYAMKRMQQMAKALREKQGACFGTVQTLLDADSFLKVTDNSEKTTVVVHIYSDDVPACETVDGCMKCLAKEYTTVKFCRVLASVLGTTKRFQSQALPTLQAYRHGQLIASMVRIQDELGADFYADKLQEYLIEHGVLPDCHLESSPTKIRQSVIDESDSDFELD